jgi:hypothetical protein
MRAGAKHAASAVQLSCHLLANPENFPKSPLTYRCQGAALYWLRELELFIATPTAKAAWSLPDSVSVHGRRKMRTKCVRFAYVFRGPLSQSPALQPLANPQRQNVCIFFSPQPPTPIPRPAAILNSELLTLH